MFYICIYSVFTWYGSPIASNGGKSITLSKFWEETGVHDILSGHLLEMVYGVVLAVVISEHL